MQRFKKISEGDFLEIQKRDWRPVKLERAAIPPLFENIPPQTLNSIYASGCFVQQLPCGNEVVPPGHIIGGFDVYRDAPDDPVALNKDWYLVIYPGDKSGMLLVQGPITPEDHWIDFIPERLQGVEIVSCPAKVEDV